MIELRRGSARPASTGGLPVPRLGAARRAGRAAPARARPAASRCEPVRATATSRRRAPASRRARATATALDGGDELPDPGVALAARRRARPVGGRRSGARSRGATPAWPAPALDELVLYELHVGTFTRGGHLRRRRSSGSTTCVELGVTAIELMPVAQFPGARNWGYDGVYLCARAVDLRRPRRAAAARRRLPRARPRGRASTSSTTTSGPRATTCARFGPYFTDRYHTPWGEAVNVDGPGSDEVRRYLDRQRAALVRRVPHRRRCGSTPIHGIVDTSARAVPAPSSHDAVARARPSAAAARFG